MGAIKVVQWATGNTGERSLRAIIDDPKLDLVGVRVYDPAKAGKDAGDLVGGAKTGVIATDTMESILALKPDIVVYMGGVEHHPDTSFEEIRTILAAGIDIVATGSPFTDLRVYDPAKAAILEKACAQGGSTFLGVGLYPGFWGEAITPLLSRLVYKCDQIIIRESLSYAGYDSPMIMEVMGFGRAPDQASPMILDTSRPNPMAGTATVVAKALGLTVDKIEPFRITALTDRELKVAAGTIPAGTVGAQRIGINAQCGNVSLMVEHVTWMGPDVEREWSSREGYEIILGGEPGLRCHMLLGSEHLDHTGVGCLATAMHAVHAIPAVRDAKPGLIDLADVPAFVGHVG